MKHIVCPVSALPPGSRTIVEVNGLSIGVFNVAGTFYALKNVCPHQGAPLCVGSVRGTTLPSAPGEPYVWGRDGEILRCPWHGWEFDLTTGRSIFNPHACRVKAYEVGVEPTVETFPVSVDSQAQVVLHLSGA